MVNSLKIYWQWLIGLICFIIVFNLLFYKYVNAVSFTNLFLLIIPNWIFTFLFYRNQTKKGQQILERYMSEKYPDILNNFLETYVSDTNPDSKPIFALFMNKELLKDDFILNIKDNADKAIMLLVCVSAITIMTFLISTVFIMRRMYFS